MSMTWWESNCLGCKRIDLLSYHRRKFGRMCEIDDALARAYVTWTELPPDIAARLGGGALPALCPERIAR